jgi:hypothetical protein
MASPLSGEFFFHKSKFKNEIEQILTSLAIMSIASALFIAGYEKDKTATENPIVISIHAKVSLKVIMEPYKIPYNP